MARASSKLARRLDEVGFSDIVQVRNKVMALRQSGQRVWGLHGGEPFFHTPEPIKLAMSQALDDNHTRYAPSSGIGPLRAALVEKLARRNSIIATENQVLVTTGGAHA